MPLLFSPLHDHYPCTVFSGDSQCDHAHSSAVAGPRRPVKPSISKYNRTSGQSSWPLLHLRPSQDESQHQAHQQFRDFSHIQLRQPLDPCNIDTVFPAASRASACFRKKNKARSFPVTPKQVIGGVTAHLDYDLEVMASFVSHMAEGMHAMLKTRLYLPDIEIVRSVAHSKNASPALCRFVQQVLSSTRLPSSTILLGLLYLSKRLVNLSRKGDYTADGPAVNSLLVVSLILSSKFVDDNTFQNCSWSEVSGIALQHLNLLEFHWLSDLKWDLHVDLDDPNGFCLWRHQWIEYNHKITNFGPAESPGKRPWIDSSAILESMTRHGVCPASLHCTKHDFNANHAQHAIAEKPRNADPFEQIACPRPDLTPPSAPDTGPATPKSWDLHTGSGRVIYHACAKAEIWAEPIYFRSAATFA